MTYEFLQNYWWILISLLAGLLVALMFVQGANIHLVNKKLDDAQKRMILNATGRKWELTFTTLAGRSSPPSRCSTAPVSAAPTGCGCSCW